MLKKYYGREKEIAVLYSLRDYRMEAFFRD